MSRNTIILLIYHRYKHLHLINFQLSTSRLICQMAPDNVQLDLNELQNEKLVNVMFNSVKRYVFC
jgi:hypothetical protein